MRYGNYDHLSYKMSQNTIEMSLEQHMHRKKMMPPQLIQCLPVYWLNKLLKMELLIR